VLLETPRSLARRVDDDGARNLYIVENEPLEALLFNRNVIGTSFEAGCLECSRLFLQHVADDLATTSDVSELVILSKGLVYQVGRAFSEEIGRGLPLNLIATRRSAVAGDEATIDVPYGRFDAGGSTLVIADTVASGATIVAAIAAYRRERPLTAVYVLSAAGALVGARRISAYCEGVGVESHLLFGLAAFGLGQNGFDLSFLHPDTITQHKYVERAHDQFAGHPASAVGWDFGSQVQSPQKYRELCWMEAEKWGLHGHPSFGLESQPRDLSLLSGEAAAFSA
jgi:hypothetical protein